VLLKLHYTTNDIYCQVVVVLSINIDMKYFKEIDLPSWGLVQKFCLDRWDGTFTFAKIFADDDLSYIRNLVERDILEVLGIKVRVKSAIMFINDANYAQKLHVDGSTVDRINDNNTALNIPILNCDSGYMSWYSGDFFLTIGQSKTKGLDYLKINWSTEPCLAVTKIINKPTIVKIDIPHHAENKSDSPRLMLSVRFAPNIPL
jgi:hypothetical protein